jgi:hypothetical protein
MRHRLKCHEPERKKGEPLVAKAAAAAASPSKTKDEAALDDCEAHGVRVYRAAEKPAKAAEPVEHEPTEAAPAEKGPTPSRKGETKPEHEAACERLGFFRVTEFAEAASIGPAAARRALGILVGKGVVIPSTLATARRDTAGTRPSRRRSTRSPRSSARPSRRRSRSP